MPSTRPRRTSRFAGCLVVLAVVGGGLAGSPTRAGERAPNVILILADDLGWGDVACQGGRVPTPAIDRLAREGRRFTAGYCSASTCTPTRYSLLTGEYAFRRPGTGIAPPNAPAVIQPGTPTLPAVLQAAGYATAVVGKWHLGLGEKGKGPDWNGRLAPGPLEIGFDQCFILPTTNDRVPQVFVEGDRVRNLDPADPLWVGDKKPSTDHVNGIDHRDQLRMDWSHGHNGTIHNGIGRIGFYTGGQKARFRDEDLADAWVEESIRWITARREAEPSRPFFLLLASHDIHVPRVPHERFAGASGLGPRGDCIVEFDWCVGAIAAALERLGMAKDSIVIVCSDNGPVLDDGYKDDAAEKLGDHRPAGPFRGGKYSVHEGGTRTPFIVWGPGRIAPGVSDEIVCTIDLPRSLATLAGQPPAAHLFPDSVDVLGALLGRPAGKGRESLLQQDNGTSGRFGFRSGSWKLVRQPAGKGRNKAEPRDALYDLATDPGETTDVAGKFPDVASEVAAKLDAVVRRPDAPAKRAPSAAGRPLPILPAAAREPIRILFIGNSYTFANDLPGMVAKLSTAGRQPRIVTAMEAPGGCTFERHVAEGRAAAKIAAGPWDYVVLQEQSLMPVADPPRTLECGGRLDRAARAAGARTLFFQTWARAGQPEMQDGLSATYAELARRAAPAADGGVGALVAPVGEAWREALETVPPPSLHLADGSHPTAAGTYLAACVFYGTIHRDSPVGLTGRFAGLDDATARRLQEIAWAVVDVPAAAVP